MPKKLLLFPCGGNAREALMVIEDINKIKKEWDVLGFIDDDASNWGKVVLGVKVLGGREFLRKNKDAQLLAAPGNPKDYLKRKEIIESLKVSPERFAMIRHPSVVVARDAKVGFNTLLMPNVVISCGVTIGNHCILLPNSVVSHDSKIGEYSCLGSNVSISGTVKIAEECYIGSGVHIREKVTIGKQTLVGIGSNVISDIPQKVVVAGNPAKILQEYKI